MTAVYDVGSNSIRMIVFDGDRAVLKRKVNCRLGEGIAASGRLSEQAIVRAIAAFAQLKRLAETAGVKEGEHFAFATEAVRRAENGSEFLFSAGDAFGIKCEIIDGDTEAEIGLCGVLSGGDGAILDIGGASSELAVRAGGKIVYSKSLKVGAGVLRDAFLNDKKSLIKAAAEYAEQYGDIPQIKVLYAIGGTASGCGYVANGLLSYDERKIDGLAVNAGVIGDICDKLFLFDDDERAVEFHLDENRAKVLPYGAALMCAVIKKCAPEKVIISERSNVEGYYERLKSSGISG